MLRPTLLALAMSCAIAYPGYGQQAPMQPSPQATGQTPVPAAAAPAPAKATTPSVSAVPMTEPVSP